MYFSIAYEREDLFIMDAFCLLIMIKLIQLTNWYLYDGSIFFDNLTLLYNYF